MGGNSSKRSVRRSSYHGSAGYGGGRGYPPQSPQHHPQQSPYPSTPSAPFCDYAAQPTTTSKLDRKYSKIADDYRSLDEVHRRKVYNFFQWYDADDNAREKNMIVFLIEKIEEIEKNERILVCYLFMAMILNIVLIVAYVRK